jgi:hypothetical protein
MVAGAVLFLLPDTVPLHIGMGGIDRWGSKFETFIVAGMLSGFNLLLTFFFARAEKMYEIGVIHGKNTRENIKGTRVSLLLTIVVLDILCARFILFCLSA